MANPLALVDSAGSQPRTRNGSPADKQERERYWIERGNRILWGQEPTSQGDYLTPQPHLEWVCRNGSYSIEPRRARA